MAREIEALRNNLTKAATERDETRRMLAEADEWIASHYVKWMGMRAFDHRLTRTERKVLIGRGATSMPTDVVDAIKTPHEHEGAQNRPLWLIWKDRNDGDGWFLDSICDTSLSAVCHYLMVMESSSASCRVERVPANHNFASSIQIEIIEARIEHQRQSYHPGQGYRRAGD